MEKAVEFSRKSVASPKVAIVIPLYRVELSDYEALSLKSTFHHLGYREDICWLVPEGFDSSSYDSLFGARRREEFPKHFFQSVNSYSSLLLAESFYERFLPAFSHLLIVQTDATVLRDDLDYWLSQPFHYIGAPWPKGWSFPLSGVLDDARPLRCTAVVGNGGFSLRDIRATLALLREFPVASNEWRKNGWPEDFFIALAASVSDYFRMPNLRVASRFSIELEPTFFRSLNRSLPFGLHAWHLYDREFWEDVIRSHMEGSGMRQVNLPSSHSRE
jgi:hypothetical protein